MSVLRVYDPAECDEHGKPLDWDRCRTCGGCCGARTVFWPDEEACDAECALPPGHAGPHEDETLGTWSEDDLLTTPRAPCPTCGGHGSLKAAALAALSPGGPLARNENHPLVNFAGAPGGIVTRCEGCGHPMSDGTWSRDRPPVFSSWDGILAVSAEDIKVGREPDWHGRWAAVGEFPVHWSPCDSACRHAGPMRWSDGRMVPLGAGADAALIGASRRDGIVEASWRQVDVRTLGWPHDLRPEKLAVLCLRCCADRATAPA